MYTDDERRAIDRAGEIDANMGRVLWSVAKITDDREAQMREILASLVRVLDEPAVLLVVGDALAAEMLARTPPPTGTAH